MSVVCRSARRRAKTEGRKTILVIVNVALGCAAVLFVLSFVLRPSELLPDTAAVSLAPGDTHSIAVTVLPEYAIDKRLTYSSDNEAVAMVDAAGRVTCFGPGNAVITVGAAGGARTSVWIEVTATPEQGVSVIAPEGELPVGGGMQLAYTVKPDDGRPVMWSSDNPAVIRVGETGYAEALAPGEATLRAAVSGEVYDEVTITAVETAQTALPSAPARTAPGLQTEGASATLMLTGDLMCLNAQIQAAARGGAYDFGGSFAYVAEIFARADYVLGNLETTIAPSFPYTASNEEQAGAGNVSSSGRVVPVLNAPAEYLDALAAVGFDAVSTANNHACDTGAQGLLETLESLSAAGVASTGTFANEDAPRYLLADAGGIRLGVIAYSEFFNGREGLLSASEREHMINAYSEKRARADIAAARAAGAEFIVVYTHWGTENGQTADAAQEEHARQLADAGADLIVGAHPHCLQPAAYLEAEDGRRVLCLYSLGNFVSSMERQANNDTVIARVELERTKDGVVIADAAYIPCRVFSDFDDAPFVVLPITDPGAQAAGRIAQALGDALEPAFEIDEEGTWQSESYMIQEDEYEAGADD